MKRVDIVLLVLAGALAGALVMKVTQHPAQVAMRSVAPVLKASNHSETVAPQTQPAPPIEVKPSPLVEVHPLSVAPIPSETPAPAVEPRHFSERKPSPIFRSLVSPQVAQASPAAAPRYLHTPSRQAEFQTSRPPVSAPATPTASLSPTPANPSSPPVSPEQPKETPPARMEPENVTPPSAPAMPVPEPNKATLNTGMLIPVRLLDSLSSERNHVGDAFAATLDHELVANGFVVAERGARVEGRVTAADRNARTLSLELTFVHTLDNQDVAVQTERFDKQSEPDRSQAATKIGAGAAIGAVIGGIAGGGKGAAIGAGAGGGIGAGDVMLSRKPASLPSETRVTFRLRAPVTVTERIQ